jgi:hypothetical protein
MALRDDPAPTDIDRLTNLMHDAFHDMPERDGKRMIVIVEDPEALGDDDTVVAIGGCSFGDPREMVQVLLSCAKSIAESIGGGITVMRTTDIPHQN